MKKRKPKAPTKTQPKVEVNAMKYETASTWASEINTAYQRYLDTGQARTLAIIETGRQLNKAKAALNAREWFIAFDATKIEKPIQMSTSYAERFMAIANHPVLGNPDNCLHLPPTVSGLNALRALDDKVPGTVAKALAEGKLNADMTVLDIHALLLPEDIAPEAPSETVTTTKPKPRVLTEAEREVASLTREVNDLRRRLNESSLDPSAGGEFKQHLGIAILPEAHCRICDVKYVDPGVDVRYAEWARMKFTQDAVTDWIKQHVRACHADENVTVQFIIEKAAPWKPSVEMLELPAAPSEMLELVEVGS